MILNLNFNQTDVHLNLEGTLTLPNDMDIGGVSELDICGLAEWRNGPADTAFVSKSMMENFKMATRLKGKPVKWIGLKSNHDILLPYALRAKGEKAVIEFLKKFFKTFSKQANVVLNTPDSENIHPENNCNNNETPCKDD